MGPAPKGAGKSVTTVSAALALPALLVLLPVVFTTAMAPASHMLIYTRLLSGEAVVKTRKRVVLGEYVAAGAQAATGGTAY